MRNLVTAAVGELPACPDGFFARAAAGVAGPLLHDRLETEAAPLHAVEALHPVPKAPASPRLRLACWNLERCKRLRGAADLLRRTGADLVLLSEMDLGMARSGNRHTTRDLAAAIGFGYAFGVEYVELGLGLGRELLDHAGRRNGSALHGNALVTSLPFADPVIVPIETGGLWFGLDWHHRRVGGRIGVGAVLEAGGAPVLAIGTHFENHGTPQDRCDQMRRLVDYADGLDPAMPVVIGGDLNTAALPLERDGGDWFDAPDRFEPLFSLARDAGFEWRAANTPQQTRRVIDDGRPAPGARKVDWIFVRGLAASNPAVWPAVDAAGATLSDHELLTVDLEVRR